MAAAPKTGAGILAFDAWIVNTDRHRKNLAFDKTTKRVQIFDHSHALYGADGQNLADHEHDIGFERPHCLAPHLTSFGDVGVWCDLIRAIPRRYIYELLKAAVDVGLPQNAVDATLDFLLRRRERLETLFMNHRADFPSVQPTLFDLATAATYQRKVRPPLRVRGGKALQIAMARVAELGRRRGGA